MRICIIEPHADDFLLGMGGLFMERMRDSTVNVLTIVGDSGNTGLGSVKLSMALKFKNKNLGWTSTGCVMSADQIKEMGAIKAFETVNNRMMIELQSIVNDFIADADEVYMPMGIHDATHNAVASIDLHKEAFYYREYPYFWIKRKSWPYAGFSAFDYEAHEKISLKEETVKLKYKYLQSCYTDQIGAFCWVRPYYKSIKDEMIFRRKNAISNRDGEKGEHDNKGSSCFG